jgi:hypothetical protein
LRSAEYFLHSAKYLLARLFGGYNARQRVATAVSLAVWRRRPSQGKMDDIAQDDDPSRIPRLLRAGSPGLRGGNYDRDIRSGSLGRPQMCADPPARDLDPKHALTAIDDEQGTATIAGVTATAW